MHARGSRQIEKLSSSYRAEANLDESNSYRASIEQTETFLMDQESVETNSQKLQWIEIALTFVEKEKSEVSIDSLAVESYREVVEIAQNSFS